MRVLALLALLAACGGGARPVAPEPVQEPAIPQAPAGTDRAVIERETEVLEQLADRTCACKDLACVEAVDVELVESARTATMNDAMTDLETWPADLDARGRRATYRAFMCASEYGFTSRASGVHVLRRTTALREYACGCRELSCTRRVRARMVEFFNRNAAVDLDDATAAAFDEEATKARRCIEASFAELAQQALLDMRTIRRDACACADADCAAAVTQRVEEWAEEMNDVAADEATTEEFDELANQVRGCLEQARGVRGAR